MLLHTPKSPTPSANLPQRNLRQARARRGAAAVEMAFIAPVMFTLIIGAVEFGRAVMVANVLTSTAREGARAGVLPSSSNTDVTNAVNSELNAANIPTAQATTTVKVNNVVGDVSGASVGDTITVTVTVPFSAVTWLPSSFLLNGSTQMRGQVVMRRE